MPARGARFRELSAALDEECRRRGLPLRPGAAEEMLASRVSAVALQLGIQESSALRTYFTDDTVVSLADALQRSVTEPVEEPSGPPVPMPSIIAAQLVSALGVAAKFAAVNVEHAQVAECVTVGSQAGDALTIFGVALRSGVESPDTEAGIPVVTVDREATDAALAALRTFAERLTDGSWRDCWCGLEDVRHVNISQLRKQVATDLGYLEQVLGLR